MRNHFQARWVTKDRVHSLRKSGQLAQGLLIDFFNGFLMVEPVGSRLGDGNVLPKAEADYELSPAWCLSSRAKLAEARKMLGLDNNPSLKRSIAGAP
jgi:hypothetical protein